MRRRRLALALAALSLLAACGVCAPVIDLATVDGLGLPRPSAPAWSAYDCLTQDRHIRAGPSVRFRSEWVTDEGLVRVMARFRRRGWWTATHMTTNIQMLPVTPTSIDLGLLRVQVFRALALSYTETNATRVVATTRVAACPP